ncbi:MAG: CDP-alcohol phosphatidyltransferase family protein, partial [Myxococcota bacterium]
NRPVSLSITRILASRPWAAPDRVTWIVLAVSLVGAALAAHGSYSATLGGAILMHLGSVLDGVDGELARLRFEQSARGAWFDTITDDFTNVVFWLALGAGAHATGKAPWLVAAGLVAAASNALAAVLGYVRLWRKGTGDFYALEADDRRPTSAAAARVVHVVGALLKQDFFLFAAMVLAALDLLHEVLPLVALGGLLTLGNAALRFTSRKDT